MLPAVVYLVLVALATGEYTSREAREDWNRDRVQLKGQGILPTFMSPQVASVCRALVGDLCPRPQPTPYDDRDSGQHPLMGNSRKHDLRFKLKGETGRQEVEIAHPEPAAWPGEKQRHSGQKFTTSDE